MWGAAPVAAGTFVDALTCSPLALPPRSTGNFFTPPRQVAFPGSLHVTSQRLCFTFEERGLAPIKLAGKALKTVAKQPADDKQGGWSVSTHAERCACLHLLHAR